MYGPMYGRDLSRPLPQYLPQNGAGGDNTSGMCGPMYGRDLSRPLPQNGAGEE